jgi:hypothetical protein
VPGASDLVAVFSMGLVSLVSRSLERMFCSSGDGG